MSKIFGYRLKKLREKRKLKQSELAKITNVHQKTISSWELNLQEPSIDNIKKLANFLKVSTDYLLGQDENTIAELTIAKMQCLEEKIQNIDYEYEEFLKKEQKEVEEYLEECKKAEILKNENPYAYVEYMTNKAKIEAEKEVGIYQTDTDDAYEQWQEWQEQLNKVELDEKTLELIYNIEPN